MRNLFGKPRPDLLSRCDPDYENQADYALGGFPQVLNGLYLVSSTICRQPDKTVLNEGFASFPSGHASCMSFTPVSPPTNCSLMYSFCRRLGWSLLPRPIPYLETFSHCPLPPSFFLHKLLLIHSRLHHQKHHPSGFLLTNTSTPFHAAPSNTPPLPICRPTGLPPCRPSHTNLPSDLHLRHPVYGFPSPWLRHHIRCSHGYLSELVRLQDVSSTDPKR